MIQSKVKQTIKKYKLCSKKDKIVVALSGGKDSSVVAYLLHGFGYGIEGLHIDLKIGDYSDRCLKAVKELCNDLGIKLHVYDMKKEMGSGMCYLRSSVQSKKGKQGLKNCAICGVIKKWVLNKVVQRLKADKIATGHNLDDEAQTFLMNVLKGSPELSANVGPVSRNVCDDKFVPRIKPLFFVAEDDVRKFSKKMKLPVVYEKCPCALDSYRIQVREFLEKRSTREKENIIKNFEKVSDKLKKNIGVVKYCEICGEPSRGKICKKCELIG